MSEELEQIYLQASNNSEEAFKFLVAFNIYCHSIDDIIDDKITDSETIVATFFTAANVFTSNYWLKNGKDLFVVLALLTNDYMDSNNPKENMKDVLRFSGNNMVKAVAFLQGGFTLLRYVSPKLNATSFKHHHNTITLEPQ